jgi:hypothetical protein
VVGVDARARVQSAWRVLFGNQTMSAHADFKHLTLGDAKRAFRRRALETHPDRAAVVGKASVALSRDFCRVNDAYNEIVSFLRDGGGANDVPARAAPTQAAAPTTPGRPLRVKRDHRWQHAVPRRPLRLGQALFYFGRISWLDLVRALAWQRRQTPRFGQIAERSHVLATDRLREVLEHRRPGEFIGEAAVRLKYLTPQERDVVVDLQRRSRRPLGEFFVEAGMLSSGEVEAAERRKRQHNAACA